MAASPRVAIVGGGLAGLTIARQLNLKSPAPPVDVEVFEASPRPGGVLESSSVDGYLREHAANGVVGDARGGAAALAADLGLEMVTAKAAAKKRWVFFGGKLREVPSSPVGLAKSGLLSARGKLRLLAEPTRKTLTGEPTVAEFFRHRLGPEVHDRVVAPFVNGIYAGDTEELSMAAAFPRVTELAAKGLFRGLFTSKRSSRRGGGAATSRAISTPSAGMEALISRLAEKLAGRIRLEEPVETIARSSRGVDIVTAAGRVEHFDAVVCAVPSFAAAPMFVGADPELAELLATVPTAPVAVVHLGYDRKAVEHPLDGFGFLAAPSEGLDMLGIVFESAVWPNRCPEGKVLLRVMLGGRLRPGIVSKTETEVATRAKGFCEKILGASGDPDHVNVIRWPRAIAQYTVGHRERLERAEVLAEEQGVVLAGASYHGVAVNSVTTDAARVARNVHQLLAAPLMLVLMLVFAGMSLSACSSSSKSKPTAPAGDGGSDAGLVVPDDDARPRETAPSTAFSPGYSIVSSTENNASVTIEVRVIAPDPPAQLMTAEVLKRCTASRQSLLVVHTLGGVSDAVVWLDDIKKGKGATTPRVTKQVMTDCAIEPAVSVVGRLDATLDVVTLMESRQTLQLDFTETPLLQGASQGKLVATLPMAPIGRGFSIALGETGFYRTTGDGLGKGWVVVAGTPYIEQTSGVGAARLEDVPAGEYTLKVWHPAMAKAMSIRVAAEAGKKAPVVEIDISKELQK